MQWLILIPFILQSIVIGCDEWYFHVKRGLPLWERIGHPLDTLSLIVCLGFLLLVPFSASAVKIYLGLGAISCLMVTKDEWVHKHLCPASENWLHALLFINHPLVLLSSGLIWWRTGAEEPAQWLTNWLTDPEPLRIILLGAAVAATGFMFYQIIYWNFLWQKKESL